ncbi:hypothetical protein ACFX2B_013954 [Malus domestica]
MHKISLIPKPKPKGAIRTRAKISFHKGAKNNTAQRSLLPLDRHLQVPQQSPTPTIQQTKTLDFIENPPHKSRQTLTFHINTPTKPRSSLPQHTTAQVAGESSDLSMKWVQCRRISTDS